VSGERVTIMIRCSLICHSWGKIEFNNNNGSIGQFVRFELSSKEYLWSAKKKSNQ